MTSDNFRMRLRVRVAKTFDSTDEDVEVSVLGRSVRLTPQVTQPQSKPSLRDEHWIVFSSGGFETEAAAREFGQQLRLVLELVGVATQQGIRTGDDKAGMSVQEEFARSIGLITADERIAKNTHGLSVDLDDGKTRFPVANMTARVHSSFPQFVRSVSEFTPEANLVTPEVLSGLRVLNQALSTSEPLAQMVMAFSVVEELAQDLKWSSHQHALLVELAGIATKSEICTEGERSEVAEAIRRSLRLSIRQRVKRFLAQIGLSDLSVEWDRLYGIRSKFFHGNSELTEPECASAAFETLTLSGHILLTLARIQGALIPSVAEQHFKIGAEHKVVVGGGFVKSSNGDRFYD